jgi:hypothetical protein
MDSTQPKQVDNDKKDANIKKVDKSEINNESMSYYDMIAEREKYYTNSTKLEYRSYYKYM